MGQRMINKFQRRFGDRIGTIYMDKPHSPAEQDLHNKSLAEAIMQVLAGILRREPTQDELLGITEIGLPKKFRAKT